MKHSGILILFLLFNSIILHAQENPLELGELRMSYSSDLLDCQKMNISPFLAFPINFIVVPPSTGTTGVRFKAKYTGSDDFLLPMEISYLNENAIAYGEDPFYGFEIIFNQCIYEPMLILSYDFMLFPYDDQRAMLSLDYHSEGGFGLFGCEESPLLHQACRAFLLINDQWICHDHNCAIACPTVAVELSTWGAIKTLYNN